MSLCIAAGGNINPEGVSMFEPMGGSAPKAFDQAIHDALASGKIKSLSAGKMGMGTREVGDVIANLVS